MKDAKLSSRALHLSTALGGAVLSLYLSALGSAYGASAAFSSDNQKVYLANFSAPGTLDVLEVKTGAVQTLSFSEIVQGSSAPKICGISPGAAGSYWLITETALWRWDGHATSVEKVDTASQGVTFTDVAAERRKDGMLLVTAELDKPDEYGTTFRRLWRHAPGPPLVKTVLRRVDSVQSPIFLDDHSILFGYRGDLWQGSIEFDDAKEALDGRVSLSAYRYAPLATLETYDGAPLQTGVSHITISKNKAYVDVYRMGGSGWGDVIRLDRPAPVKEHGENTSEDLHTSLAERLDIYGKAIRSVEVLYPRTTGNAYLCGSKNGTLVHYSKYDTTNRRLDFLITNDGQDKQIAPKP